MRAVSVLPAPVDMTIEMSTSLAERTGIDRMYDPVKS
jgi:hypothetical protein